MFINQQLELFVEELEQAKERKRMALTAARSLIREFQIPEDAPLNFVLNVANARSNEEALMMWILMLTPETEYLNTEAYRELADNLRRTFMELENPTIH